MREMDINDAFFKQAITSTPGGRWERDPYKTNKPPSKDKSYAVVPLLDCVDVRPEVAKMLRRLKAPVFIGDVNPHYDSIADRVILPHPSMYHSEDLFYHSLFHELGHWTGKKLRRLTVEIGNVTKRITKVEEMVAELTAVFLCYCFKIKETPGSLHYLEVMGFGLSSDYHAMAMGWAKEATRFLLKED